MCYPAWPCYGPPEDFYTWSGAVLATSGRTDVFGQTHPYWFARYAPPGVTPYVDIDPTGLQTLPAQPPRALTQDAAAEPAAADGRVRGGYCLAVGTPPVPPAQGGRLLFP